MPSPAVPEGSRDDAWDQGESGAGLDGGRGAGRLGGGVCRARPGAAWPWRPTGSWRRCRRTRRPRPRIRSTSAERLDWHFIPRPRKGLPIKELSPEQRALAFGLIQSGLAGSGFLKATTIMSLEQILRELEKGAAARSAIPSCIS